MALVQWAPGQPQLYGKYIGSAFTTNGNNPTLIRNPTAANRQSPRQVERRQYWRETQRYYKLIDEETRGILDECAENNPYVNSRGVVSYGNRYLKWLQIGVYQMTAFGDFFQGIKPYPAAPVDWYATNFVLYADVFSETGEVWEIIGEYDGTLVSGPNIDVRIYIYISRPISAGVTAYKSYWHLVWVDTIDTRQYSFNENIQLGLSQWQPGDWVFVRWDVVDFTAAAHLTSQLIKTQIVEYPT